MWSPSGRYLAWGRGSVYDTVEDVRLPKAGLRLDRWTWSPVADCLIGLTGSSLTVHPMGAERTELVSGAVSSFGVTEDGGFLIADGDADRVRKVRRDRDADRADAVVLRDPGQDGKLLTIARGEVEERRDGGASIMPGYVWFAPNNRYYLRAFPPIFPRPVTSWVTFWNSPRNIGVSTAPGAMAITRILSSNPSRAIVGLM